MCLATRRFGSSFEAGTRKHRQHLVGLGATASGTLNTLIIGAEHQTLKLFPALRTPEFENRHGRTSHLTATPARAGIIEFGHGTECAGLYCQASGFSDQLERKRIYNQGQFIDLIGLITFSWLIQSQPHTGSTSAIAAEENSQSLVPAHLSLEIAAGIVIYSKHNSPLRMEYKVNACINLIHIF